MESSSPRTKTIIVLHLLSRGAEYNSIDKQSSLCNQTQDIRGYNILYIPVPYKIPIEYLLNYFNKSLVLSDAPTTLCDGLLIYAKTDGDDGVRQKLESFLLSIETFKNTLVFYDNYNRYEEDFFHTLRDNKPGLRILNVYPRGIKQVKRYTHPEDNHEMIYVPMKKYEESGLSLVCTWWFRYYIGKVFGCGSGRLIQQSGTCYLTAVINGIVLSDSLSRMVLMYMKNALLADQRQAVPTMLKIISTDIVNPDISRAPSEVLFLYRIMYNMFCKHKLETENPLLPRRLLPRRTIDADFKRLNIFKQDADAYFSQYTNGDVNDLILKYNDEGGSDEYVLYRLFYDMGVKFVVLFGGIFYTPRDFGRFPDYSTFIRFVQNLQIVTDFEEFQEIDLILNINGKRTDLQETINIQQQGVSTRTTSKEIAFELETSTLNLIGKDGDEHVICGFKCDGYYRTYDSSLNDIGVNEWNKLGDMDVYVKILENINMPEPDKNKHFESLHISCSIYLNKNKKAEYHALGKCS